VVFIPELGRAFWFDLAADPAERDPRPLDAPAREMLDRAHLIIDSHRALDWPDGRAAMNDFAPWTCSPRAAEELREILRETLNFFESVHDEILARWRGSVVGAESREAAE
jgi:hypothetical protein